MPKNKAELRRIQGIDNRLNRLSRIKSARLASIFDVTIRQISRDIKYMKDTYNAPIKSDNKGYYYTEKFSLSIDLALTNDEISRLKLAVKTLNQFQHLDTFSHLENVLDKIDKSVHYKLPNAEKNFIFFETIPFYKGTELIEIFINAIEICRTIIFDYHSFKSESVIQHCFHPYILKEHTNRWYVIGYLPLYDSITSFALDRVVQNNNLSITDKTFKQQPHFDIDNYFKYTYGMTVFAEKKIEKIELSFAPLQAKYFETKPFHHYEVIDRNEYGLIVKMNLIINFELIRKLASYGNGVKILTPSTLIKELVKYHKEAIEQYS